MMVDRAKHHGYNNVVLGMAHRGRLNTLACVFNKPYEQIFGEFKDVKGMKSQEDEFGFSGDVKYHLGATNHREYPDGSSVHITMMPNPSHLETVNTVAMGKARSKMDQLGDPEGSKVITCLIHGDAAFAGQGIVYEGLQMERLRNYQVGGVIHVIVNNQVGFTTNPIDSRSTKYCTDLAKTLSALTIHVNAQYPEYVDYAFKLAVDYNHKFKRDVFIDVIGYRKLGHNEQDLPQLTQPLMYSKIAKIKPMHQLYCEQLIGEGVVTQEEIDAKVIGFRNKMQTAFDLATSGNLDLSDWDSTTWKQMLHVSGDIKDLRNTGWSREKLRALSEKVNTLPTSFKFHKNAVKVYETRHKTLMAGTGIAWDTAEQMAFATLLEEGYNLRLAGEDVERGTFVHRQSVLYCQETGLPYTPLSKCVEADEKKFRLNIANSLLSEYGVLGYEYGYSIGSPNCLTIWEAQFGDFANVAQATTDTFFAAGERKWGTKTGMVMLLPHGYDGAGPEHSSCRVERFLQLMDDDPYAEMQKDDAGSLIANTRANMMICNVTNPANFFHLMRQQLHKNYRKPLVVLAPKKLLRHKLVKSNIEEFEFHRFRKVYPETQSEKLVAPEKIRRVINCTGQVYFDLLEYREKNNINDVVIQRIEQIAPFPYLSVKTELDKYVNADIIVSQEEHRNQGPWNFFKSRMGKLLKDMGREELKYRGRPVSGSTAVGSPSRHKAELEKLLRESFDSV